MDIVWPAVQQDDRRAIKRARFGVTYTQYTGIDLFDRAERGIRPWRNRRDWGSRCRPDLPKLCGRQCDRSRSEEKTAIRIAVFKVVHWPFSLACDAWISRT